MTRRAVPILFIVAMVASGCGARSEPLGPLAQEYPVRVEGAGDQATVLTAPAERIIVLDPGSAELLLALDAGERLVGVPAGLGEALPDAAQVVQSTGQVSVDAVIRLEPDLIVATPAVDQVDVARSERESGAVAYVQPASSVDEVVRGVIELGFLVGRPAQARVLAGSIREEVGKVERRVAGAAAVPVFIDTGFLITVPERSLVGDLVRRARGQSVAGPNPGPDPFEACEVARLEPAVLLLVVERGRPSDAPSFRDCPEGADIRVERIPADLVLRPGPRLGEALAAVARALHPDAFG
jgi:iron complex transport system substrate-binding protein/vitamin B12 transport system substrate-binding protein